MISYYVRPASAAAVKRNAGPDRSSIQRFRAAQDDHGHYDRAIREMRRGVKETHWMWYVFPQLRALAKSGTSVHFGLADRAEATRYVDDPVLRVRLAESTMAVLGHKKLMFPHPDNHKLRACMTLFAQVVKDPTLPNAVLEKFYAGVPDQLTLDVLAGKKITLPKSRPVVWHQPPLIREPLRDEPMDRREIEAFLREHNLPGDTAHRIAGEWLRDRKAAIEVAWDEAYDSISEEDR